ncbi:MAG: hypothetical protein AAF372_01970 [Pseudomonadota bacterium]
MPLSKVACLLVFFCSTSAHAIFISKDWSSANDNLLTLDTDSGLEWLDWSYTTNRSFSEVSGQFGSGGEFEGFRHATLGELNALYSNAGFNFPTSGDAGNIPLAVEFVNYFGMTFDNSGGAGSEATYANPGSSANSYWVTAINQNSGLVVPEFFEFSANSEVEFVGNALVRTSVVPIPLAFWLFSSAMLGLFTYTSRKQPR